MKFLLYTHNALNLGDVAIVEATIQHIHSKHKNPEIVLESNYPEASTFHFPDVKIIPRMYSVVGINHDTSGGLSFVLKNLPFLFRTLFTSVWSMVTTFPPLRPLAPTLMKEARSSDFVLSVAGDSISQTYAWYLRFYELLLLRLINRRPILYAQSIGPFSGIALKLAPRFLNMSKEILARDKTTFSLLKEYGVTAPLRRTADTVISLKPKNSTRAKKYIKKYKISKKTAAVVIRSSLYSGIKDKDYAGYLEQMHQVVKYIKKSGDSVIFVGTIEEDCLAAEAFNKKFNTNVPILRLLELLPSEAKTVLGASKVIISPRMHPVILGTTGGASAIGILKEFKLKDYLEGIRLNGQYVPIASRALASAIKQHYKSSKKPNTTSLEVLSTSNAQSLKGKLL